MFGTVVYAQSSDPPSLGDGLFPLFETVTVNDSMTVGDGGLVSTGDIESEGTLRAGGSGIISGGDIMTDGWINAHSADIDRDIYGGDDLIITDNIDAADIYTTGVVQAGSSIGSGGNITASGAITAGGVLSTGPMDHWTPGTDDIGSTDDIFADDNIQADGKILSEEEIGRFYMRYETYSSIPSTTLSDVSQACDTGDYIVSCGGRVDKRLANFVGSRKYGDECIGYGSKGTASDSVKLTVYAYCFSPNG